MGMKEFFFTGGVGLLLFFGGVGDLIRLATFPPPAGGFFFDIQNANALGCFFFPYRFSCVLHFNPLLSHIHPLPPPQPTTTPDMICYCNNDQVNVKHVMLPRTRIT